MTNYWDTRIPTTSNDQKNCIADLPLRRSVEIMSTQAISPIIRYEIILRKKDEYKTSKSLHTMKY